METMTLFQRHLNRWERQYGLEAAQKLQNKLLGLRMARRYAKGTCGEVIKQVIIAGAAREEISVALFLKRCFANQKTSDIIRYIDPVFAEKVSATNRIAAKEMAEILEGFLHKKRMGMPLSVEEQEIAHRAAHLLSPYENGELCCRCVSEGREHPIPKLPLTDFPFCLEHTEAEINARVVMTA
jgi:hypothetical protein